MLTRIVIIDGKKCELDLKAPLTDKDGKIRWKFKRAADDVEHDENKKENGSIEEDTLDDKLQGINDSASVSNDNQKTEDSMSIDKAEKSVDSGCDMVVESKENSQEIKIHVPAHDVKIEADAIPTSDSDLINVEVMKVAVDHTESAAQSKVLISKQHIQQPTKLACLQSLIESNAAKMHDKRSKRPTRPKHSSASENSEN